MKKVFLHAALAAAATLGLTSETARAFSPTRPRADLVIATSKKAIGQNTWNWDDSASRPLLRWTHDTLFELTYLDDYPKLRTVLAADRAEHDSTFKKWTIRIKKGLRFSDETPITADRFVTSWKQLEKLPADSASRRIFHSLLKSYVARDELTLDVELHEPDADFEFLLTLPFTAPSARSVRLDPPDTGNAQPGSGPFILKEWQAGFGLILDARKGYSHSFYPTSSASEFRSLGFLEQGSKPLPLVDSLRVDWMANEAAAWKAFREGRSDVLELDPSFSAEVVDSSKPWLLKPQWSARGIKLEKGWAPRFSVAILNLRTLPKLEERRAILSKLGVDFWKSLGSTSTGTLGSDEIPLLEDWIRCDACSSAVRSSADSALPKSTPGRTLKVEVLGSDSRSLELVDAIQSRFRAAPFIAEVRNSEPSPAVERFRRGEIDLLVLGWNWDVPTIRNLLEPIRYLEPADAPILKSLELASSPTKLRQALRNAAIWSPGPRHERRVLVQPWVFGYRVTSASESPEKYLRVDREIRRNYQEH